MSVRTWFAIVASQHYNHVRRTAQSVVAAMLCDPIGTEFIRAK